MGLQWTLSGTADTRQRKLSVEDVFAMVEAGIIGPDERLELIDGVLVEMSPKNVRHERVKIRLSNWLVRHLPEHFCVAVESTLKFSDTEFVEPDIVACADRLGEAGLTATDCLLVIEIADSSLAYDLNEKAQIYAQRGIRELWVIDVRAGEVTRHRGPDGAGWAEVDTYPLTQTLHPLFAPDLAVNIARVVDA